MPRPLPVLAFVLLGGIATLAPGCSRNRDVEESSRAGSSATESVSASLSGREVYEVYCAVCHMEDGTGVPNFQPPLVGSPVVKGDPALLEAVVRAGSAALGNEESKYGAPMPPFGSLSDDEVAAVVAYVRDRFASGEAAPAP